MGRPPHAATSACCIGAGRMGGALARAADCAGLRVTGSWSRSSALSLRSVLDGADVAFVAVPDDVVGPVVLDVARSASAGQLVLVTSGAARIAELAAAAPSLRISRMHPMQAVGVDAPDDVLDGAVAAITAAEADVAEDATRIAERLGMRPVPLADEHAATWHAAGTVAAGGIVATLAAARDLAVQAGLDPEAALDAVGALAASAISQARASSPELAITGPVARGDDSTVAAHRTAIAHAAPALLELYVALATRAAVVAGRRDAGTVAR